MRLAISPEPSAEEAAAIVAATEALWPTPVIAGGVAVRTTPPWRFSGRWWVGPVPLQRTRP